MFTISYYDERDGRGYYDIAYFYTKEEAQEWIAQWQPVYPTRTYHIEYDSNVM